MLPITIDLSALGPLIIETLSDNVNDTSNFGVDPTGIEPAPTETGSYPGEPYSQPDPLLNPFPEDAVVVGEASKTVYRWQDNWQPREIIVQKLYSESYDATWTNAYVPDDTFVFIREQELLNGTQPVQGMTQVDGTDYFWAQSGMTSGSVASQACVSLPVFSFGGGHDLYDHICTDFS